MYYQRVVIILCASSVWLPSLASWPPTILQKLLGLYLKGHKILNTKQTEILQKLWWDLMLFFLISYVPYHAFCTYIICTEEQEISSEKISDILHDSNYKFQYTYLISTCFLSINSCLNPVALFCTSSPFRQHLKCYLTCFAKQIPPCWSRNCKKNLNL
jgi:hypothetical protein